MALHRYFGTRAEADEFARGVKKSGGRAKVVPYNGRFEAEWSGGKPPKMKMPRETRETSRRSLDEARHHGKPSRGVEPVSRSRQSTLYGRVYAAGQSCGRGKHAWVSQGTYLKCSRCGSSRSLR